MPISPQSAIKQAVRESVRRLFSVDLQEIVLEYPPRLELGDFAAPVAFELARRLKRNPRAIAEEIVGDLAGSGAIAGVEVAGGGYINIFLERKRLPMDLLSGLGRDAEQDPSAEKVIVEHTNINPNKAAHIGHLRNAVLGDTLVRLLRHSGRRVEVQNYIDDTGVQVADLVVGFMQLTGAGSVEEVEASVPRGVKLDYHCWDLYSRVSRWYEEDASRKSLRADTLKKMEDGEGPEAAIARHLSRRIVECHLDTMERIGVRYDLLPWESHIIGLKFWARAFEELTSREAIRYVDEGDRKGCWIMDLPGSGDAAPEEAKIIVRSNGTVTYVGKDMAYQLWKTGLLGMDFNYVPFRAYPGGAGLWSTSVEPGVDDHPQFGRADRVFNVIDVRQSYPQRVVQQGLRALGHDDVADRSHHFAYEMVALSPACARALGLSLSSEEEDRTHIEMSGRKGYGVKADDLIDALVSAARKEVAAREREGAGSTDEIAAKIAIGALRYFMIKYTRNKVIAFDFDEVLSFEGETGPYILYAVVRASNIFRKMAEREGFDPATVSDRTARVDFGFLDTGPLDDHWELLNLLSRFDDMVEQSIRTLEPSIMARYAFTLAQRFNHFYHQFPVMQEPDENLKMARIVLTHLFIEYEKKALDLMGIEIPPRM